MSREQPVLQARQENDRKLQTLRAVHGHQRDLARTLFHFIRIAVRRYFLEKLLERRLFSGICLFLFVIVDERFEVQQVFDAALRLRCVLGLQRFEVAALDQQLIVDVRHAQIFLFLAAKANHPYHVMHRALRLGRQAVADLIL